MADGLDDVAGARLSLRAEHRRPFRDTPLRRKKESAKRNTTNKRANKTEGVQNVKKKKKNMVDKVASFF